MRDVVVIASTWASLALVAIGGLLWLVGFLLRDRGNQTAYDWMTNVWVFLSTQFPATLSRQAARRFWHISRTIFGEHLLSWRMLELAWVFGLLCWIMVATVPFIGFLTPGPRQVGIYVDFHEATPDVRQRVVQSFNVLNSPDRDVTGSEALYREMASWPGVDVPLFENTRLQKVMLNDLLVMTVGPWFTAAAFAFTRWSARSMLTIRSFWGWSLLWLADVAFAAMAGSASLFCAEFIGSHLAPGREEVLVLHDYRLAHGALLCGLTPLLPMVLHTGFYAGACLLGALEFVVATTREVIERVDEFDSWPIATVGSALVGLGALGLSVLEGLKFVWR